MTAAVINWENERLDDPRVRNSYRSSDGYRPSRANTPMPR